MSEKLNSIDDAVDRLRVGRKVVERLLATGELKSVTIGRRRLITESELLAYISRLTEASA
jgi:excisionase family DNA binding protein